MDVILNQEITVTDIGNNLLTFAPAAQANGAGYANFKFAVIDDGNGVTEDATPNTITFDVTSVSDAPSGSDKTITMNEDATQTLAATDFGFSDATDAGSSAGADSFVKVKITTLESAGALKLNGVDVILNQEITVTDIGNNLLTFAPAAEANGAGYANFKFAVIDDGNGVTEDATPNTITFDVTSVSDAPSGSDKTITMNEDATQTLAATDFGFSDATGRGQLRRCRQFCQGQDHDPGECRGAEVKRRGRDFKPGDHGHRHRQQPADLCASRPGQRRWLRQLQVRGDRRRQRCDRRRHAQHHHL